MSAPTAIALSTNKLWKSIYAIVKNKLRQVLKKRKNWKEPKLWTDIVDKI